MQCCKEKEKPEGCSQEEGSGPSNGLDVGKFFLLTVISGGLYLIYWFYRNWRHIKEHTKSSIRPAGRTVLASFPVLDIVLFSLQLKAIYDLAKKQGSRTFPLVWTCIGVALIFIASWALLAALSITYGAEQFGLSLMGFFLSISIALILMPVQLALNDFWKHAQPARADIRASYTNGEKAWLVVGSLLMVFGLLVTFIMPPPIDSYYPGENYKDIYGSLDSPDLDSPTDQQEKPAEQPSAEEAP